MNQAFRRKQILSGSIALSLLLHAVAIVVVHRNSIWISAKNSVQSNVAVPYLASMSKEKKSEILKEAFNTTTDATAESKSYEAHVEMNPLSLKSIIPDPSDSFNYSIFFPSPTIESDLLLVSNSEIAQTFHLPSENLFNLLTHLPRELITPPPTKQSATPRLPVPIFHPEKAAELQKASPKIEALIPAAEVVYADTIAILPELAEPSSSPPVLRPSPMGSLPQLPTLAELETTSYSDEFETDLVFMPKENGQGYLFALTLIPRADLNLPKIRQHYMFLIDRANSIQRERLLNTKNAVYKALEDLKSDDTFNIAAFDTKMEKLSPSQLAPTNQSLAKADEFLGRIDLGSFFSPADAYKPLILTVPSKVLEDEIYTAILLTDGESLSKKNHQRSLLQQWTSYNEGKVALYVVGMDEDRNLPLLEAACALNRGKLITSNTKRGFKRRLLKVMKSIQSPVAKNLSCRAFSRSPTAKIEIFPKNSQTPHLYLGQPYVIIGTTDTLDDFILFVQGRLKDRWLNIKKNISFISAKKGGSSLKSEWALHQVHDLYEQYLKDNNSEHLAEARALLEPLNLQIAFQ